MQQSVESWILLIPKILVSRVLISLLIHAPSSRYFIPMQSETGAGVYLMGIITLHH